MSTRINVPELKKYMDKRVSIQLNANRRVTGVLRGFDPFMNVVLDETEETRGSGSHQMGLAMIRGNSIVMVEAMEKVA